MVMDRMSGVASTSSFDPFSLESDDGGHGRKSAPTSISGMTGVNLNKYLQQDDDDQFQVMMHSKDLGTRSVSTSSQIRQTKILEIDTEGEAEAIFDRAFGNNDTFAESLVESEKNKDDLESEIDEKNSVWDDHEHVSSSSNAHRLSISQKSSSSFQMLDDHKRPEQNKEDPFYLPQSNDDRATRRLASPLRNSRRSISPSKPHNSRRSRSSSPTAYRSPLRESQHRKQDEFNAVDNEAMNQRRATLSHQGGPGQTSEETSSPRHDMREGRSRNKGYTMERSRSKSRSRSRSKSREPPQDLQSRDGRSRNKSDAKVEHSRHKSRQDGRGKIQDPPQERPTRRSRNTSGEVGRSRSKSPEPTQDRPTLNGEGRDKSSNMDQNHGKSQEPPQERPSRRSRVDSEKPERSRSKSRVPTQDRPTQSREGRSQNNGGKTERSRSRSREPVVVVPSAKMLANKSLQSKPEAKKANKQRSTSIGPSTRGKKKEKHATASMSELSRSSHHRTAWDEPAVQDEVETQPHNKISFVKDYLHFLEHNLNCGPQDVGLKSANLEEMEQYNLYNKAITLLVTNRLAKHGVKLGTEKAMATILHVVREVIHLYQTNDAVDITSDKQFVDDISQIIISNTAHVPDTTTLPSEQQETPQLRKGSSKSSLLKDYLKILKQVPKDATPVLLSTEARKEHLDQTIVKEVNRQLALKHGVTKADDKLVQTIARAVAKSHEADKAVDDISDKNFVDQIVKQLLKTKETQHAEHHRTTRTRKGSKRNSKQSSKNGGFGESASSEGEWSVDSSRDSSNRPKTTTLRKSVRGNSASSVSESSESLDRSGHHSRSRKSTKSDMSTGTHGDVETSKKKKRDEV